jgi:pullulanase
LLAQGVPFLEGGVEIGRTKGGNGNSYNAGDAVNKYDWTRATKFNGSYNYMKGLIAIRKAFPEFRLSSGDAVRKTLKFLPDSSLPVATIAFTLEAAKKILVVFHGSTQTENMQLPAGNWAIHADGTKAGLTALGTASGNLKLEALSSYVLVQK